jgi:hypothetical protein
VKPKLPVDGTRLELFVGFYRSRGEILDGKWTSLSRSLRIDGHDVSFWSKLTLNHVQE